MVNVVAIIVPIVVGIIIIAVSLYLFTVYCHPEQRGIGNQLFPKILVILSQTLAWGQLLLLPLDQAVGGAEPDSTYYLVYDIIYPIILALVTFFNPFAMFLYQSDQNQSLIRRICWSTLYAFIVTVFASACIFISYIWLGVYNIGNVTYRLDAALYVWLALSLAGWVLLAFNGAVGLIYLPHDLIAYFASQPNPLTSEQAFAKKADLQFTSSALITQAQKLREQEQQLRRFEGGWFSRKRAEAKFQKIFQDYKKRVNKLQQEYAMFTGELDRKASHPIVYIVALIFGILASILSLFWWVQMLGAVAGSGGVPLYGFVGEWMGDLAGGSASFVATLLYGIFVLYMEICLVKGNLVFGIRIPFLIKVHPMIVNKTYINSLLFNSNLMLLASCAISLQSIWSFPQYFTPTTSYLSSIYNTAIINLPMFGTIYGKQIPMIILEALVLLVLIIAIAKDIYYKCFKKKQKGSQKEQSKEDKELTKVNDLSDSERRN